MTAYQVANWPTPPKIRHHLLVNVATDDDLTDEYADLDGTRVVGFETDSDFDTSDVMFQVAGRDTDGTPTTFQDLYDSAFTQVLLSSVTASASVALDPTHFLAWDFVKVKLGTGQADNTIVTLVSVPL